MTEKKDVGTAAREFVDAQRAEQAAAEETGRGSLQQQEAAKASAEALKGLEEAVDAERPVDETVHTDVHDTQDGDGGTTDGSTGTGGSGDGPSSNNV